jgi:hypothetical protein
MPKTSLVARFIAVGAIVLGIAGLMAIWPTRQRKKVKGDGV